LDLPGHDETILLVEDTPYVRELVADSLHSLGYEVLPAADGDSALALARRHSGHIDLLFTDCVMSGQSGPETASLLLRDFPEMAVLFASGYVSDSGGAASPLAPNARFLFKPFTLSALAEAVYKTLHPIPTSVPGAAIRSSTLRPTSPQGST